MRSLQQLLRAPLAQVIPDFEGSTAAAQFAAAAGGSVERRIDHFSPVRYTWYEIRVVPASGSTVLFIRDVTDRMRQTRSEAVREAIREIVMDAPIAITITRGPEHRYEVINNFARQLIGNRDVEGRTARNAFPEIDPALFDLLDDVYKRGTSHSMRNLTVRFDRDGDGESEEGTFDVTYQPLFESDGRVSGILSISVEVSGGLPTLPGADVTKRS